MLQAILQFHQSLIPQKHLLGYIPKPHIIALFLYHEMLRTPNTISGQSDRSMITLSSGVLSVRSCSVEEAKEWYQNINLAFNNLKLQETSYKQFLSQTQRNQPDRAFLAWIDTVFMIQFKTNLIQLSELAGKDKNIVQTYLETRIKNAATCSHLWGKARIIATSAYCYYQNLEKNLDGMVWNRDTLM